MLNKIYDAFKNVYLSDWLIRLKYKKVNKHIYETLQILEDIDSIRDFELFKQRILELKQKKDGFITINKYGGESYHYGHLQALYDYAGINRKANCREMSRVEHGINWYEHIMSVKELRDASCLLYQGCYKKNRLLNLNSNRPIFSIGPYINYARPYYNKEKIEQEKKKNGKTMLVIPFHNNETTDSACNDDFFVDTVQSLSRKESIETIIVLVYWNDVSDPVYTKLEKLGAKLVSAGYREDQNFIRRLRTIFGLSDIVVSNSIGTHVGYALAMKKPYINLKSGLDHFEAGLPKQYSDAYFAVVKKFDEEFSLENFMTSTEKKQKLYEYYWGGDKQIRTSHEIKLIIEISHDIMVLSLGFVSLFSFAIKFLLIFYKFFNEDKWKLLNQALSKEGDGNESIGGI